MKAKIETLKAGYDFQKNRMKILLQSGVLESDKWYEVDRIEVNQSSSYVYLVGNDEGFNTVFFEFDEDVNYGDLFMEQHGLMPENDE